MKSVLTLLVKNVLSLFGSSAAMLETDAAIQKKIHGSTSPSDIASRTTGLIISMKK